MRQDINIEISEQLWREAIIAVNGDLHVDTWLAVVKRKKGWGQFFMELGRTSKDDRRMKIREFFGHRDNGPFVGELRWMFIINHVQARLEEFLFGNPFKYIPRNPDDHQLFIIKDLKYPVEYPLSAEEAFVPKKEEHEGFDTITGYCYKNKISYMMHMGHSKIFSELMLMVGEGDVIFPESGYPTQYKFKNELLAEYFASVSQKVAE